MVYVGPAYEISCEMTFFSGSMYRVQLNELSEKNLHDFYSCFCFGDCRE